MNPYFLFTRDPRQYDQMTGGMGHTSRADGHYHERAAVSRSMPDLSRMISAGTLHAVNAVERGWSRLRSLIRG